MEPQTAGEKVLLDEKSPTLTHRSRIPPPRRSNAPLIIGIILVVIIIIGIIVFFLLKGRSSTQSSESGKQKGASAKTSPTPTPNLYQLVTIEISEQRASLSAIENDIKELNLAFKYESVKFSDILTPTPPQTPEWQAQKTDIAKARGELEIVRRTSILNKLIPRVNSAKKLSKIQKFQLVNEINLYASYLSSLREIIAKQTNFQELIGKVNTLSDSYKSLAVIVPKVHIMVIADKINVLGDEFTKTANKLIEKTEKLRASKKDVTAVQKTLGHMLFMMGDAANRAEIAVVRVFPLTPEGYPKNKSILLDGKSRLQKSSKNLSAAAKDAQKVSSSLAAIESGKSQTNFFQFFQLMPQ